VVATVESVPVVGEDVDELLTKLWPVLYESGKPLYSKVHKKSHHVSSLVPCFSRSRQCFMLERDALEELLVVTSSSFEFKLASRTRYDT